MTLPGTEGESESESEGESESVSEASGSGVAVEPGALGARARQILERHWQPEGYTVPNGSVYPHQWLWDSCFHAVIWAHLGEPERAVAELRNVFAHQADDGFVPHLTYWREPHLHEDFWGRPRISGITQPPMYGHAIAELRRLGIEVDRALLDAAVAGLEHLFARTAAAGTTVIVHPWETGCDDSPRWDAWCPGGYDPLRWKAEKGRLVAAIAHDPVTGSPIGSDVFEVASSAFDALLAFNATELAPVAPALGAAAHAYTELVRGRWDDTARTFVDGGNHASRGVRTLEALLPVLVLDAERDGSVVDAVFADVLDERAYGGECGPAQVHRAEPGFDPTRYWRGPTWPQLTYLLWVAARRAERREVAAALRARAIRGAVRSGFAEYWDPDTGRGQGAVPQSWTGLVAVLADPRSNL